MQDRKERDTTDKWGNKRTGDPDRLRHSDLIVLPQFPHNCIICGDGFNSLLRPCHLHPDICDACEREYCECMVEDKVELESLEETAKLSEENMVAPLLARKMTLKLAGKITSSMPLILHQPNETRAGFFPVFSRRGTADDEAPSLDNVTTILEGAIW